MDPPASAPNMESVEVVEEESFLRRPQQQQQQKRTTRFWHMFGRKLPRSEIVFFCQTFLIYVVVVTSLVNLTLKNGPINLWIALLGSCLGYLLPHPSIDNISKQHQLQDHHQQQ